ncbi:MAG: ABC transporter permease [Halanaerobiales bacterium]|nr:ABC transporter permease [Halanaerobiales bacterium]
MSQYIMQRLLMLIPILLGVTMLVFSLMHISGDPILLIYGTNLDQEIIAEKRHELGLDQPIYRQYLNWVGRAVRGNLGLSIRTHDYVWNMIRDRIKATLELTIIALVITLLVSIPAGIISAVRRYTLFDQLARFFALFWVSMPYFWLGLVLMLIFGINLQWLPISGRGGFILSGEGLRSLILPSLTLGLPPAALFMRVIRSNMLEVINEDYVRTARSKGLIEYKVIIKHAFRNALLSVLTLLGLRIPWLFGGAVITETVFAWPGMGRLLVDAIMKRDYPVVQGIVLLIAILVVIFNIIVDLLYAYLDPRIRFE